MNLLPLAFIPNTTGFTFTAFTKDSERIVCKIEQGSDGMHYVVDEQGQPCYSKLKGWMR